MIGPGPSVGPVVNLLYDEVCSRECPAVPTKISRTLFVLSCSVI